MHRSSAAAKASGRIRPSASVATRTARASPKPAYRSAASGAECASAPMRTSIGGAPTSPSRSTSHPRAAHSAWRAAITPTMFAVVAPETSPAPLAGGRPSRSITQSHTARSMALTAGVSKELPAFWPHAETSMSAATPTGWDPPST